ncbi:hypothetical protein C8F04DRAFT_1400787 [Mycena alexandri]|uniref:Uncharacterized protein n=1 Tax=Mycena alexandri TaxID=1745969 RepID=A0AAD6SEA9_9AGAR|nr:hypothetical protein C8F04DRAFT_1400787 [Mycena alexandri]
MSDLTVLVSPIPLYPGPSSPLASRRKRSPSPIMVTLESDPIPARSESAARTAGPSMDPALLSPPINTWKARSRSRTENQRNRHRPTRSQSAPPTQTTFDIAGNVDANLALHLDPDPAPASASVDNFNLNVRPLPRRSRTTFGSGYAYVGEGGMTMRGGELVRPPPPLLRPTTFWRKAHRSGVAAASYSPASHLIRRSTFIAAGLAFDYPIHDLSALCVESRITGEDGITGGGPRVVELPQAFELLNL